MFISIVLTVLFVFGIPLLAVLFATYAGMAICLISFYLINPIVSVASGVYSAMKKRWYICLFPALVFIITAWSLFTINEPIFIFYSAVYLVFSFIAMFVTSMITNRKK